MQTKGGLPEAACSQPCLGAVSIIRSYLSEGDHNSMAGVTGRVALVTGASQGIGRACALALAEGGAMIALAARNEEKLAAVAKEIESKGGQAATFRMDVSNEADVKAAVKAVLERFGKIEILVNNAGVTR